MLQAFNSRKFWYGTLIVALVVIFLLIAPMCVSVADAGLEDCIPFAKAGDNKVYRCEDWELGKVCYIYELGMVFCLEQ